MSLMDVFLPPSFSLSLSAGSKIKFEPDIRVEGILQTVVAFIGILSNLMFCYILTRYQSTSQLYKCKVVIYKSRMSVYKSKVTMW